jgi:fructokinase
LKILVVGEAFIDVFPNETCVGGAPLNFAVHLAGLGASVFFATRVGNDNFGQEIVDLLERWEIKTAAVQIDNQVQTGRVHVSVNERGEPNFTISGESAHDFFAWDEATASLPLESMDLLYLGTLGSRHPVAKNTIDQITNRLSACTKIFFDVNLRGTFYSRTLIEQTLSLAHFVKLNERELKCVQRLWNLSEPPMDALKTLADRYHIEHLCLTQGAKGGVSLHLGKVFPYSAVPCDPLVNSMGAGDAFSAMLAMGLLQGQEINFLQHRAAAMASAICAERGAIPHDRNFYKNK